MFPTNPVLLPGYLRLWLKHNIVVDMIIQNASLEGLYDLSFTVSRKISRKQSV
jgi:hypothetical protein